MYNILKAKSIFTQEQDDDSYNAFKRPPDFTFAERHALACRFASAQEENVDLCPCCGMPIQNQQLPLCCDKQDINFNGAGIPLYFEFIQFTAILLAVLGLISGIYNIINNLNGDQCNKSQETCSLNYYNKYSLTNRASEEDVVLYILDLISTICIIGITIYYRRWMNLTALEVDNAVISISDYSIQVSNLPLDSEIDEIKEFFSKIEKKGQVKELQIEKVCLGYNIQQYTSLINQKLAKEVQLGNLIALDQIGKQKNPAQKAALQEEIKSINSQIQLLEENHETKFQFSGVAFITFNTSQQAQDCRKYHNQTMIQLMFQSIYYCFKRKRQLKTFKGKIPYVVRAPEPGDVMWENLGEAPWNQFRNQIWTNLATLLILGACFGAILGISIGQDSINNNNERKSNTSFAFIITFLGLVASFVISFLNTVMAFTIKKLVLFEKPYTQTDYNISYANKLGMSQFINTAIIPLLVNVALQKGDILTSIWKNGGLNSDVSLILIMNAIFPWVINISDPMYNFRVLKRYLAKSKGDQSVLTQREANILFEGSKSDLSQKYATIVKSIMLTLFYAQLLPLGIPIALGFLLITYWVEKVLLLRRSVRGAAVGKQLAEEMVDLYIELALVLFAAGNCIWQKLVIGEIHAIVWAQLGISGFQLLIPVDWIFYWLIEVEEAQTNETYIEKKAQLWDDYSKRNPITQQKSIEEWVKEQGGKQDTKIQGFLQKLQIKQQQDLNTAQHKLMKKFIPKSMLDTNNNIKKNFVFPINNADETIVLDPKADQGDIRKAESILFMGKRETAIVPTRNNQQIIQAQSIIYD